MVTPLVQLSVYHTSPPTPSIDYIVDSGAACVSYMPTTAGFDQRSLTTLEKPVPIASIGWTAVVTATGIAYAKTICNDGRKDRLVAIRFDAAAVPALQASGIGLLATQSLVYDGGLHSLRHNPVTIDEITLPGEIKIFTGAIGALKNPAYRVRISAPYVEGRGQNLVKLQFCSQQEIESLVPVAPKSNRGFFASADEA